MRYVPAPCRPRLVELRIVPGQDGTTARVELTVEHNGQRIKTTVGGEIRESPDGLRAGLSYATDGEDDLLDPFGPNLRLARRSWWHFQADMLIFPPNGAALVEVDPPVTATSAEGQPA
jgi:hypothetical protein